MSYYEPKFTTIDGFYVSGLSVCTKNTEEFNPLTAKLPALWQQFMTSGLVDLNVQPTPDIFGVYSDYDSDASGYYRVTAGLSTNIEEIRPEHSSVAVVAGNYLVFSGKGLMPVTVIALWQKIWLCFSENQNYKRNYLSDFELYRGVDEIEIFIGYS
ncbi:MAG: effector binding domain-containing protein [Tatlockia sp.]|nr:effector binding domain-containing protein [Tatlockia sp.]